ncbi:MAG: HEPN domain-containing protein [Anaerolineae bacterium]|nr:HEPN domain-containing protein [Anaerolineae bacterium]
MADWLRIAEKDWERAAWLLDQHDSGLAGFCLQQAVEKFLKAFLISQGWELRRTHDLEALLDDVSAYETSLVSFRDVCQRITAFYFAERYPLIMETGITEENVRASLEQVRALVEWLRINAVSKEP